MRRSMLIVVSWRDRRNHPLLFLVKSLQPYVAILGEIAATICCYSWRDRHNHLLLIRRSSSPSDCLLADGLLISSTNHYFNLHLSYAAGAYHPYPPICPLHRFSRRIPHHPNPSGSHPACAGRNVEMCFTTIGDFPINRMTLMFSCVILTAVPSCASVSIRPQPSMRSPPRVFRAIRRIPPWR